jgi:hypothetical protein
MKKFILCLFLMTITGCYFAADGPYWLNGSPINTPCWMDADCRAAQRIEQQKQDDCHSIGWLYGWIDGYMRCLSKESLEAMRQRNIASGKTCKEHETEDDFNVFCFTPFHKSE